MTHREEGDRTEKPNELRPVDKDTTSAVEKSRHIPQRVCAEEEEDVESRYLTKEVETEEECDHFLTLED